MAALHSQDQRRFIALLQRTGEVISNCPGELTNGMAHSGVAYIGFACIHVRSVIEQQLDHVWLPALSSGTKGSRHILPNVVCAAHSTA